MLNVLAGAQNVTCGNLSFSFDPALPELVRTVVLAIKIFIPVILIIFGMLDMGKAVMAGDEKAMKENQGKFIKRLFYAVLVFLIISIVQVIISIAASTSENSNITACISCFTTDKTKCVVKS